MSVVRAERPVAVDRVERVVFGERRVSLKLRLRHGQLTLMACGPPGAVGLRPVATKRQIEEALYLRQTCGGFDAYALAGPRYRLSLAKVASWDILQAAEVVRDLDGMGRRNHALMGERRRLFKARESSSRSWQSPEFNRRIHGGDAR